MGIYTQPRGVFNLSDSDISVGSFFTIKDLSDIFQVEEAALSMLETVNIGGINVVDEKIAKEAWKYDPVLQAVKDVSDVKGKTSFDELVLRALIRNTYPEAKLNFQVRKQVGRSGFLMDIEMILEEQSVFIEFDGPPHFTDKCTQFGPKHPPLRKKKMIEEKFETEVVNWPYWIQRCESNVRALFESKVQGYGVLWSTNVHFGDFIFDDSAAIITEMTKRFNAIDSDGFGYMYGPNTKGRNNVEHEIIEKIKNGKIPVERLLPKGYTKRDFWLPDKISKI